MERELRNSASPWFRQWIERKSCYPFEKTSCKSGTATCTDRERASDTCASTATCSIRETVSREIHRRCVRGGGAKTPMSWRNGRTIWIGDGELIRPYALGGVTHLLPPLPLALCLLNAPVNVPEAMQRLPIHAGACAKHRVRISRRVLQTPSGNQSVERVYPLDSYRLCRPTPSAKLPAWFYTRQEINLLCRLQTLIFRNRASRRKLHSRTCVYTRDRPEHPGVAPARDTASKSIRPTLSL
mgnify:CR=1 FL=1